MTHLNLAGNMFGLHTKFPITWNPIGKTAKNSPNNTKCVTLREPDVNSVPALANSVILFSEGCFSLIHTRQTLMNDSLKQPAHKSICETALLFNLFHKVQPA